MGQRNGPRSMGHLLRRILRADCGSVCPFQSPPHWLSRLTICERNVFWYQTNRKFSSNSHFLVHNVYRVPQGTTIGRYLRVMAAFASSGVMHLIIDLSPGTSVRNFGAVTAFMAQALGLIMEEIVIGMYQTLPQRRRLARML